MSDHTPLLHPSGRETQITPQPDENQTVDPLHDIPPHIFPHSPIFPLHFPTFYTYRYQYDTNRHNVRIVPHGRRNEESDT